MEFNELFWIAGGIGIFLTLNGLCGLLFRVCLVARVSRVSRDYSQSSAYKKTTVHRTGIATGTVAVKTGIYHLLGAGVGYVVAALALFGIIKL